jgi:hypothetical protein
MDPGSINYNPKANEDDGSCLYGQSNNSSQLSSMVGVWEEFEIYYISHTDIGASPQNPSTHVEPTSSGGKITINSDNSYSGTYCNGNSFVINNSTGLVDMDCYSGVLYFNHGQSPFASESTTPSSYSGNILYLNFDHSVGGPTKTMQFRYRKL